MGDDYYTVHSTFEHFPGVPIFHSKDLVHWRQIGHVLTRKNQLNLDKMRSSGGIFAPTPRYHNGTLYMITTLVWGGGNFYVSATNAAGPWSDPVWHDREGIDPSLFFDDDGKVYYTRQVGGERGFFGQLTLNLQILDGKTSEPVRFADIPAGEIVLSVKATPLSYQFFHQPSKHPEQSLGTALTRDLSSETLTAQKNASFNFTGVFIGMYARGNGTRSAAQADFDWFEYRAPNE